MSDELRIPTLELLSNLREMQRQWIAQGRRLDMPGRLPSSPGASNVAPICQALEVTSSTADSYGYPARIQTYDGTNWTRTYAECRAVQIGSTIAGAVLATGPYPIGRLMYVSPTGLHVYGVHPGAGGATELKGLTFTSDTGSQSDSDPGNGKFRWNNATQASATVLYFDNQTADAVTSATFFASLLARNQNGFVRLQQYDDSTKWQLWKWTAVVDGTGYHKFTVVLQGSGGSIADAKTVLTEWMPCHADASATAVGIVNLSNQVLGTGIKSVNQLIVGTTDFGTWPAGFSAHFFTDISIGEFGSQEEFIIFNLDMSAASGGAEPDYAAGLVARNYYFAADDLGRYFEFNPATGVSSGSTAKIGSFIHPTAGAFTGIVGISPAGGLSDEGFAVYVVNTDTWHFGKGATTGGLTFGCGLYLGGTLSINGSLWSGFSSGIPAYGSIRNGLKVL